MQGSITEKFKSTKMSRLLQIVGKSGEREIVMLEGGFYWHPWTGIDGVLDVLYERNR